MLKSYDIQKDLWNLCIKTIKTRNDIGFLLIICKVILIDKKIS